MSNKSDLNNILDKDCMEYSEKNLNETRELRELYIKEILDWYLENPGINGHLNENYILYFLRSAKFDLAKAKKKIISFYAMRRDRIEWFNDRNPFLKEINELLDIGVFLPLKKFDNENRLVVIIRTAAHDPRKHLQNNVFKTGKMILDYALHSNMKTSIYGVFAIFDMKGISLGHALQLTPTIIKRAVHSWENYPCRIGGLRFINAPFYINVTLNVFKSFMSAKLKSRISVTYDTSIENLNLCDIPTDLGGTGESYNELAKYWKNIIETNSEWFKDDEKYKSKP